MRDDIYIYIAEENQKEYIYIIYIYIYVMVYKEIGREKVTYIYKNVHVTGITGGRGGERRVSCLLSGSSSPKNKTVKNQKRGEDNE